MKKSLYKGEGKKWEVSAVPDQEILDLYWNRQEDAIAQTQHRYGQRLQYLAQQILGNPEDAQECVNDTLLAAWNPIPPKRPQFLFSYLAKVCRNFALGKLDWLNAAKRKAQIVELTQELQNCIPDPAAQQHLEGEELGQLLNRFLTGLSRDNRVIFLRRYFYMESVREIAAFCGISESKVKTQLHRTRMKLFAYLQQEGIAV